MKHRIRSIIPIVAGVAAVAVLAGCSSAGSTASTPTTTASVLKLGAQQDVISWDPAASSEGHQFQYELAVYDTLLKWSPSGSVLPNVATKWNYDAALTTLTFTIRSGIKFSDGEPLDAAAVASNIEAQKAGTGNGAGNLSSVKTVTAPSATSVVLELSTPDPALLYNLAGVAGELAAPKAIGTTGLKTQPVGSGPYTLDASSVPGSKYVFDRVSSYWGGLTNYPYKTIEITPLVDDTARFSALQSGQVDAIAGSGAMVAQAKGKGFNVALNPGDRVGLMLADRTGAILKPMGDVRVRQAINYAIDSAGILNKLAYGYGYTTDQIFAKTSLAYDSTLDNQYKYNVAKAKSLLKAAGYPNGFTLPFVTSDYFTTYQATFKQLLGAVGITVDYTTVPAANLIPELLSGKYPAYFYPIATTPSAWKDTLFNASPTGQLNFFKSETPELDALLKTAGSSSGSAQAPAMKAISKYLVDNAWFDPWYVQDDVYIYSKSLKVTSQAGNIVPLLSEIKPAP